MSWNTADELEQSLRALPRHDGQPLPVIVVDNHSSDNTVAMLRDRHPRVRVIANATNDGFASAANQGWQAATTPFCLLLNPDTVLNAPALEAMVALLSACPTVGACAPVLLDEAGHDTECARPFPGPTLRLDPATTAKPHGGELPLPSGRWGGCQRAHWLMGACILLRREALAQVDGLDAGYFLYGEDIDLGYRLFRAGWDTVLLTDHSVVHLGDRSSCQVPSETGLMRRYDAYFRYLAQAHGGRVARSVYVWWMVSASLQGLRWLPRIGHPQRGEGLAHERGRLRYCLTHLGRPFWCARFGRNHEPSDAR